MNRPRKIRPAPQPAPDSAAKYGFPPIAAPDARLLILGSLPGEDSLLLRQYYGHKRNHFWPIVAALFNEVLPVAYAEREALLVRNRCALWDVLASAERLGSLDSAIKNPTANTFAEFFAGHPEIETIAFNGQKAHSLFQKHVVKRGVISEGPFRTVVLPSSSPIHVRLFEEKLAAWRAGLVM